MARKLTRSLLVELVTAAVEIELGDALSVQVEFDAWLPDRQTGNPRQVDVAVRYRAAGREFLRIVEVQARSRKMDEPFVDQVQGKAHALGAHRATLVSTAGFTKPALARIGKNAHFLDAHVLEADDANDWPTAFVKQGIPLQVGEETRQVLLERLRYVNANNREVRLHILWGAIDTRGMHPDDSKSGFAAAVAFLKEPGAGISPAGDQWVSMYILGQVEGRPVTDLWVKITVDQADGSHETLKLRPRTLPGGRR